MELNLIDTNLINTNLIDTNLININQIKIIRPGITEKKFRRALKKISKLSEKYDVYMAIDYEFNTKKIALMQIMFQIDKFYLNKSNKNKINSIKRFYILCNKTNCSQGNVNLQIRCTDH
jgi:hypothetical protein